jgi:hypothetical protein
MTARRDRISAGSARAAMAAGLNEHDIHKPIYQMLVRMLPLRAMVHHSPNEIRRSGKAAIIEAKIAKSLGTIKGWPDLQIWLDERLYAIEVKRPGEKPTDDQMLVAEGIVANGGVWACVQCMDHAVAALRAWGLAPGVMPDPLPRGMILMPAPTGRNDNGGCDHR